MSSKIEQACAVAKQIANDNRFGYDQTNRWGPNFDCSSMIIWIWEQLGVPVKTKGATYTGNMYAVFTQCGFSDVTSQINQVTGSGLQAGDILLNVSSHVCMYVGDGQVVNASSNEYGKATGGASGDQTGKEICVRSYYRFYKGWDYILRYTAEGTTASATATPSVQTVVASSDTSDASRKASVAYNAEVSVSSFLRVRTTPGGAEKRVNGSLWVLPPGLVVSICEESGEWGRLNNLSDAWVSLNYLKKV